jgi:hypothetical protein
LTQRYEVEERNSRRTVDWVDLPSQLEDLLSAVRSAEENWRFDDRLDLAVRLEPRDRR